MKAFEPIEGTNGTVLVTYEDDGKEGYIWTVSTDLHIRNLTEDEAWNLERELHRYIKLYP